MQGLHKKALYVRFNRFHDQRGRIPQNGFQFIVSVHPPCLYPGSEAILAAISADETSALPGGSERLQFIQGTRYQRTEHLPSKAEGFDRFMNTLDEKMDLITNYFIRRQNSGFVEGLNHKIRVLLGRCYGVFNRVHLFQRLSLDLGGYEQFA